MKRKYVIGVVVVFTLISTILLIPLLFPIVCGFNGICTDFRNLGIAIKMYKLDYGKLPLNLKQLLDDDRTRYLSEMPIDPWGNAYGYFVSGDLDNPEYILLSYGPDGQLGGENDAADISSNSEYCK